MGLTFPADLDAWQRWQLGRQSVTRRLRGRWVAMRGPAATHEVWVTRSSMTARGAARVVGVLDSRSPTALQSVLTPLRDLDARDATLISSSPIIDLLPAGQWRHTRQPLAEAMSGLIAAETVAVAIGHFLPIGAAAFETTQTVGATFVTVQHGLLTPFAPPLAPGTTLLAWSQEDADFWTSSRSDVTARVVGSSLQWEARGRIPAAAQSIDPARAPAYLGQLHAAELPRRALVASAERPARRIGRTLLRPIGSRVPFTVAGNAPGSPSTAAAWLCRSFNDPSSVRSAQESSRPPHAAYPPGFTSRTRRIGCKIFGCATACAPGAESRRHRPLCPT